MTTVRMLDSASDTDELIRQARRLLAKAVPPHLVDDRFSGTWAATVAQRGLVGAVAYFDSTPKGGETEGGEVEGGEAQGGEVEGGETEGGELVGFAGAPGVLGHDRPTVALDCLVAPDQDRSAVLGQLCDQALAAAQRVGADRVEFWLKPSADEDAAVFEQLGAEPYRALHQMRCPLPVPHTLAGAALATRSFVPGQDDEQLLRVNNRAFANHPVQGTLTLEHFRAEMQESWFQAEGIRMYEIDGTLAGFCWTKQHLEPRLGEIYVICIDPAFHGRGLGRPMTAAGLDWLVEHGETTGMLYVEADNTAALRTYEGLGFEIVRTDRAWVVG